MSSVLGLTDLLTIANKLSVERAGADARELRISHWQAKQETDEEHKVPLGKRGVQGSLPPQGNHLAADRMAEYLAVAQRDPALRKGSHLRIMRHHHDGVTITMQVL